jgi:DNA-binding response OmpR family regulator
VALMAAGAEQVRVLLVEDDDGDAFPVEELLREAGAGVEVQRVRLLADARKLIRDAACVLLDLGLPDSQGLDGLRRLLRQQPDVAVVVLTEGDILMTREAFEFYKMRNALHVATDGEQALKFLRRTGPFADAPRPGLILLDVNLPRVSGLEVLAELKQDPELAVIPVVMLTTSQAEEDILRSYQLHANAYVSKPVDFENFMAAIRQIDDFFLTLVKLP